MYEPIAIVGTACRFPGAASSPSKLWELLKEPRELVKEFPPERLHAANFYHKNGEMHGCTNVERKSYLLEEDIRHFDAAFFRINPKEAADMDPQQRILLETVYETFEAAGWSLTDVDGTRTSVHVASMADDHAYIQSRDPDTVGSHAATGVCQTFLSNRISYAFNLQGASVSLNTACSGSLVALHLAIQGLHRGEASQAIVAGCNLLMDPLWYIMESSLHMLSPTSHSSMWDKDANGYARGEGCAAVVLKTLSQAIRDGDHIETIIRGTGVNSDGRTNGITMPSPTAQTALIRQTYRDAGLDSITDRCQYFECHGTGTQAGDPVEAEAIRDAFFPDVHQEKGGILYCGSIKTVIGHLEGCAGLAGVIKASLAIQNRMIPPNLHFNQLNPKVEPFYSNLQIPTSLLPWPETHDTPRRASVNSFGFGGTNAHAILESFEPSHYLPSPPSSFVDIMNDGDSEPESAGKVVGPFVFSARSSGSLVKWLKQMLIHLRANPSLDLDSLSHHLYSNRTVFPYRLVIPAASDHDELITKLEDQINSMSTSTGAARPESTSSKQPRILGIFTGQGAQAAQMGYALLKHCKVFRDSITECELALQTIPEPPTWSLSDELAADAMASRVSKAKFSQPLCTALQIGLVDLLRASGIRFAAVVGHSSGEIGAAYAAGLLTRRDAMGIAYYRGHVAHLAQGATGQSGGMMAAAMSFDDAQALCSEVQFKNRIGVAASNSPASVTLSGDSDAIMEMKEHLDKRSIQARLLQVDTAYHSHHMLACSESYLENLKRLDVRIQTPPSDHECHWYSSVQTNTDILAKLSDSGLEAQYWLHNMVQPVLFTEAVRAAVQSHTERFTAAVEVGPHPALRGPASQTLKQSIDYSIPYTGCLNRGKDGVEAMLEMLSAIWNIVPSGIDFAGWRAAFCLASQPQAIRDLPPYAWDHDQLHWRESRLGHNYRLGQEPKRDLLGRPWNDSSYEKTWRNIFKLSEMPWVKGHVFQGQVLFPAAGYVSLAVDAAKSLVKGRPIKSLEVRDMTIPTALVIGERDEVEVLFTIRSVVLPESVQAGSTLESEFVCYSYPDQRNADRTCHGRLLVHLGEAELGDMAPTSISQIELTPFSTDRFYRSMSELGFGYGGDFRAIKSLNKSWGHAKAVASWHKGDLRLDCTLHPAILDVALQAGLSTFVSTAERSMPSSYLPVGIKRLTMDPNENYQSSHESVDIEIEAYMTSTSVGKLMETDINVCTQVGNHNKPCGIQVEGVVFQAISEQQPSEDRNIMAKTVWGADAAYGLAHATGAKDERERSVYSPEEYERVALFYMQSLRCSVDRNDITDLRPHVQVLINHIDLTLAKVQQGSHPILQRQWLNDTSAEIDDLLNRDPNDVDMGILRSNGERNLAILHRNYEMNNDVHDPLSSSFHPKSFARCRTQIAELVRQISHKYPRCNILEISDGDSNTTSSILTAIADAYESYTCAGGSESVLNRLKENVASVDTNTPNFRMLDIETEGDSQGMAAGTYDIVIATNIFNGSRKLSEAVENARTLLRPGGFLIALEMTGASIRPTIAMGLLESWWVGADDGRKSGPGIDTRAWDKLLQQSGFSGIDCIFHDQSNIPMHSYSVFATQAVDDRLDILRDPLTSMELIPATPVVIIGGNTSRVSKLIQRVRRILRSWTADIQVFDSFDLIDFSKVSPGSSVICLQDLDKPLFSSSPNHDELENLKEVMGSSRNILWVTSGRLMDNPYATIMVGIGRSLRLEFSHVNLHFLDFDGQEPWDIQIIIAQFLRLLFSSSSPSITEGMLWVEEPETVVKDAQLLVGRIMADHAANEVYNAKRRRIVKPIDPAESVEIVKEGDSSKQVLVSNGPVDISEGLFLVQVKLSVALTAGDGPSSFLCYGHLKDKEQTPVFALSNTDSSLVAVERDSDLRASTLQECNPKTLVDLASFLIASHIVSSMPSHGLSLVCGASGRLVEAICSLVTDSQREVLFVEITKKVKVERPGWIYVHPQNTTRLVHKMMPRGPTTLVCLSKPDFDLLLPCLPTNYTLQMFNPCNLSQQSVRQAVATYQGHQHELVSAPQPTVVNIKDVSENRNHNPDILSTVTNWDRHEPIDAVVRGLEPRRLLSPNKTYLLVGMASELGQSLTYFMVRGGARYIVLASRNPKDEQHWIDDLRATGIVVRLLKMDVANRSQVRDAVSMLRRTMPEIGGVANAALVMEAGMFANLSAGSILRQLEPKVYGTVHLDEEFKTDNLDFFLTFGSLATVIGNAGQAMYHAGNMFMLSLVARRRNRGQAASVLNFGMLTDVGFVARSDRATGSNIEGKLRAELSVPLSEADFHHLILQGIVAGHPGSPSGEVIMGIEPYLDQGDESRPPWVDKAFLSHMVRASKTSTDEQTDAPSSAQQWSILLEDASTVVEAIPPITALLSAKIESMIHVSLDSIHADEPVSHLGIDSINAIEIRRWLREKLRADVSMLKILGRDSSSSMIRNVAEQYIRKKTALRNKSKQNGLTSKRPQPGDGMVPAKTQINGNKALNMPKLTPNGQQSRVALVSSKTGKHSRQNEASSTTLSRINSSKSEHELDLTRSEGLSFEQAGYFYLKTFSDEPKSFNLAFKYRIEGALNVNRFTRAFNKAILHHDSMRTCFFADPGSTKIMQHVAKNINIVRLSHMSSTKETAEMDGQAALDTVMKHEFSLATGDTFQAILVNHTPNLHSLVIGFHNIAIDTMSIGYFLRDIGLAYQFLPLTPDPGSFIDYTRQQAEDFKSGRMDESIAYWKRHLDPLPEALPLLPLAKVKNRQGRRRYGRHYLQRELSSEFAQNVTAISQAYNVTEMQFYLSTLQIVLCRVLKINDICIGITYTGRDPMSRFAETLGHMANILPVHFRDCLDKLFPELLANTMQLLLRGLDNAQVPFAALLEKIGNGQHHGNMPLFQVAFDYRVHESVHSRFGDCNLTMDDTRYTTLYDLTLDIHQTESGGHMVKILLTDDYYPMESTEFMMESFFSVLESAMQDPSAAVKDYKCFSDSQLRQATSVGRGPDMKFSWPDSLSERLEKVTAIFPNSIAVKDGDLTITYNELKVRVGRYARFLLDTEATAGSLIAVHCNPSIDLYTVILAIFHIGAVFVPIDASSPIARRRDILSVCKPHLLVYHAPTASSSIQDAAACDCSSLNLSERDRKSTQDIVAPEPFRSGTGDTRYILFTSGSTGTPKGIMLTERGNINFTAYMNDTFGFEQIKVLQQTSMGFDLGLGQMYLAFANGGTLVAVPVEARGDPEILSKIINDEGIQLTMGTPSEYSLLVAYCRETLQKCISWRSAITAGEALPERLIDAMKDLNLPNLTLTDAYGPAEAYIVTSAHFSLRSDAHDNAAMDLVGTIGKAVPNTSIYITSENDGSPLPPGMQGEICMSGCGVANGYFDPTLGQDKFVEDRFAPSSYLDNAYNGMYKSGDRGVLRPDGSIKYLGRAHGDNTVVKLRGLRIDLNEVTGAILEAAEDDLADVAVTMRGDPQFLVSHVTFKPGRHLEQARLMNLVQALPLPRYMIPSVIVPMERLPITSNGKLDIRALDAMPLPVQSTQNDAVDTMSEAEKDLRKMWIDVIGEVAETVDINLDSDFFAVGGNSMLLVQLLNAVKAETGTRVPLPLLRQASTLRIMAAVLEKEQSKALKAASN